MGATELRTRQVWCHPLIVPALRRQMQEDHEFEASLRYIAKVVSRNKTKKSLELCQAVVT
jgi:hypothetical protein